MKRHLSVWTVTFIVLNSIILCPYPSLMPVEQAQAPSLKPCLPEASETLSLSGFSPVFSGCVPRPLLVPQG